MTADTISPTKPIYRLDHLKIPFLCPKQRPSETFQTAFAGFRLPLKITLYVDDPNRQRQ
ncbi:hypothetical protein HMPREF0604_01190 [Neisseria mucosa C102]|uniref:Uncharacterized protein n=1 Tax=Neisseria mucosa C102 TaxID=435832 RepID=A0ABN0CAN0_NEIMU|nr:hypothetical protein HMPREF0604_01190 [Neisseria mucosa C102]